MKPKSRRRATPSTSAAAGTKAADCNFRPLSSSSLDHDDDNNNNKAPQNKSMTTTTIMGEEEDDDSISCCSSSSSREDNDKNDAICADSDAARVALQQINNAMQLLPAHETLAYRMAQERCPHLITEESNPALYLHFHHQHQRQRRCGGSSGDGATAAANAATAARGAAATEAARRLARYWAFRLALFADDRAYRNMLTDLTGNGALTGTSLQLLLSGNGILLPPSCCCRSGSDCSRSASSTLSGNGRLSTPVLFCDRTRTPDTLDVSIADRQRQCFFALTKLMKTMMIPSSSSSSSNSSNSIIRTNEDHAFVILFVFQSRPTITRLLPAVSEAFTDMLRKACPLYLKACHVLCVTHRNATFYKRFFDTFYPIIRRILNRHSSGGGRGDDGGSSNSTMTTNPYSYTVDIGTRDELRKKLCERGFNPEYLPGSVGGDWSYDGFDADMRQYQQPPPPQQPPSLLGRRRDCSSDDGSSRSPQHRQDLGAQGIASNLELLVSAVERHQQLCQQQQESKMEEDGGDGKPAAATSPPATSALLLTAAASAAALPAKAHRRQPAAATPKPPPPTLTTGEGGQTQCSSSMDAFQSMIRILDGVLAPEETAAYHEARRLVPLVVLRESDPRCFLLHDRRPPFEAARCLAAYWTLRCSLFRENAFRPLRQIGGTFPLLLHVVVDLLHSVY
jgi:hypothetical protein